MVKLTIKLLNFLHNAGQIKIIRKLILITVIIHYLLSSASSNDVCKKYQLKYIPLRYKITYKITETIIH